ncbi:MAG: hypothetical protein GXX86_03165 [Propionibacterium sp.]|nr:hypothetical protein [Propionibacterium sp.]
MVLLTYLSADEMASIHEQFGRLARIVPALDIGSFPWVVPGIVIATLGLIVAVYFGRSLPTGLPPKLLAAGVVYGAGALGVEIITGFVKNAYPDSFMIYQVLQTGLQILEEGLEMIACVMVIAALLWVFERDDDRLPRLAKHLGQ